MPRKFYMRMNYPIAKRIQDSLYSLLCTLTRESSPVNICLLMHNAPAAHPCRLQQPRYTHVDPTIRMTHTGSIQWRLVNYQNILRSRPLYQNWSYIVIYWRHHIPGGRYRRAWELGRTSCVSGFLGPLGMSSSYLFVNTDEANFSWKLRFPYPEMCNFWDESCLLSTSTDSLWNAEKPPASSPPVDEPSARWDGMLIYVKYVC